MKVIRRLKSKIEWTKTAKCKPLPDVPVLGAWCDFDEGFRDEKYICIVIYEGEDGWINDENQDPVNAPSYWMYLPSVKDLK